MKDVSQRSLAIAPVSLDRPVSPKASQSLGTALSGSGRHVYSLGFVRETADSVPELAAEQRAPWIQAGSKLGWYTN